MSYLLVNLSFLIPKATGISIYAKNVFPFLKTLDPTLLVSQLQDEFSYYLIPENLTPDQGTQGHLQRLLWTQFQLPKIYKKLQANLLFSPIPEAPLFANCSSVVMVHDLIPLRFPNRFSPLIPYFRYYIPQVLTQAEHIICNSNATAKDINEFFQIPAEKITPIHLAYDANHFRFLDIADKNSNRPYFIYIGRHDPYKNLKGLINAFAALPNCLDYELWLVGSTDRRYTPIFKQQAEKLGISEQVKFLDYVPYSELPKLINQALALVFPSLWEGFGLPVLEAMACGTPVITSNISSLPEVAGDAAILVNPYNPAEITTAMHTVATDDKLRSQLRAAGIARSSQFSWAKTGQATVEVLQKYL